MSYFGHFGHLWQFWGYLTSAPGMGHVIHQNDRLVKPYWDNTKTVDKKHFHFVTMATIKLDDFAYFLVLSGFHTTGFHESCNTPKWPSRFSFTPKWTNFSFGIFSRDTSLVTCVLCGCLQADVLKTFVKLAIGNKYKW
jgi:hypothetical protein